MTINDYLKEYPFLKDIKLVGVSKDLADFNRRLGESRSSAGYNQILGPIMINLYKGDEKLQKSIANKFCTAEVSSQAVKKYFSEFCSEGGVLFHDEYSEKIDIVTRRKFVKEADEFIFETIRVCLKEQEII